MSTALKMVLGQHAHDGVVFDDEDVGHGSLGLTGRLEFALTAREGQRHMHRLRETLI
jgi:hypothetical protein